MPVKKKKIDKKVKRNIKKAVEQLPGLMVEHVKFKEIERPQEIAKLPAPTHHEEIETSAHPALPYRDDKIIRQKKIWLWTGVFIFSVVVFTMWAWNMRAVFLDSFTNTKTEQPGLTETAQTTWQNTIKTLSVSQPVSPSAPTKNESEENDSVNLKEQIKNNIISIFYAQQASTTATSTN